MKNIHVLPKEEPKQDYSGVHLRHCYQGEYKNGCKYGEDDCPAKPLEEPKQESLEEAAEKLHQDLVSAIVDEVSAWNKDRYTDGQRKQSWEELFDRTRPIIYRRLKIQDYHFEDEIEEAAERLQKHKYGVFISKDADVKGQLVIDTAKAAFATGFVEGAKWQAERMYSEEELKHAFFSGCQSERQIKPRIECWEQWFEQHKKKSYDNRTV